jgi:SSS family solute:Na+ symporter
MDDALLSATGTYFLLGYLASMILVGVAGKLASKEASMKDFYLGGTGFGVTILFLTMYATQYSGNSLIGFAGSAYRNGWFFLVSVTFMVAIVGGYLLYAPRLYPLARAKGFITVGDFIHHRYNRKALTYLVVAIGIFALSNYMLTNLKAIGYIIETVTGGRIGFTEGVVAMAFIMVIYETLGGMRSVAWTDAIQGILLFVGVIIIFAVVWVHYGSLASNTSALMQLRADLFSDPAPMQQLRWFSILVLIFFGISVYPQAIQRIYAANSEKTLRRSLQLMVVMPFVTTLPLIVIAIIGAAHFPGLDKNASEQIVLLMLKQLNAIAGMEVVLTLFVAAAIAAIMSTVDSAMLAIASLFTQDIYRRQKPHASQKELTYIGKIFSWALMGIMVYLAISLPSTIWWLIQIKLELLCQIAPAVMLGVWIKRLSPDAVLVGLLGGVAITLFFLLSPLPSKPLGLHAGVLGLAVNFALVFLLHTAAKKRGSR